MKKTSLFISLFVIVLALFAALWFAMANKFEDVVIKNYLTNLQDKRERGWIDFDPQGVKIEKYKFKVTLGDFIIWPNADQPYKFEQISVNYNPFTDMVDIYNSGKVIFFGNKVKLLDPIISLKISKSVLLIENLQTFSAMLNSGKLNFIKSFDDSVIFSLDPLDLRFSLNANDSDEKYDWNIKLDTKDSSINHAGHFKNFFDLLSDENKKKINEENIFSSLSILDNLIREAGAINYKFAHSGSVISRNLDFGSIISSPFSTKFVLSANNNFEKNEIEFVVNANETDIKANLNLSLNTNYSDNKITEIVDFRSSNLAKRINMIITKSYPDSNTITDVDLKPLLTQSMLIRDFTFMVDGSYNKQTSNFEGNLDAKINKHKMNLSAKGEGEKYSGMLKLFDPISMIHAKAELLRQDVFPAIDKIGGKFAEDLKFLKQMNDNTENNGLGMLQAFGKNQDLKPGDDFEAEFEFDFSEFDLKINNKPFVDIINDERVVKFFEPLESSKLESSKLESSK